MEIPGAFLSSPHTAPRHPLGPKSHSKTIKCPSNALRVVGCKDKLKQSRVKGIVETSWTKRTRRRRLDQQIIDTPGPENFEILEAKNGGVDDGFLLFDH